MSIKFYKLKDPGGYMSNFYPARMYIYKRWWTWAEAPYQVRKTFQAEGWELIHNAKTARESRELGQKLTMRPDWDQIKREVMKEVCLAKFLQHPDLRKQLMATGTEELIEDTKSTNDMYWGCGTNDDGQNNLGKILMEIRDELKGE